MPFRKYLPTLLIVLGFLGLAGLVTLVPAHKASAQCGSQASSCKTCHETEAKKPVNNDGTGWHQSHAFGDFCYICHAGNNQSTNQDEAHTGMVAPLSDPKAACMSCHPNDLDARVAVYTAILGSSGGAPAAPAGGVTPEAKPTEQTAAAPAAPVAPANPPAAPAAPEAPAAPAGSSAAPAMLPGSGEVVNYTARYDEIVAAQAPTNWGNLILLALIALVAAGGGVLVYWNERRLRGAAAPKAEARAAARPAAPVVEGYSSEVTAFLPMISHLNPVGLASLRRLLQNPDQANEVLHNLSHLDPEMLQRLRNLDSDTRSLLMALSGD